MVKKNHLFCLAIVFFSACTSQEKDSSNSDSLKTDSIVSKIGGTTPQVDSSFKITDTALFKTLEEFPSKWVMLTEVNNNYVRREYCESENPSIEILKVEEDYTLAHNLGQMAELFTITSFNSTEPGLYVFGLQGQYGEGTKTASVLYQNNGTGLATWTWANATTGEISRSPTIYVEKEKEENYPILADENCDEYR